MRLIDADQLNIKKYTQWFDDVNDRRSVERMIREAPTVDAEEVRYALWLLVGENNVNPYETQVEEKCSRCGRHVERYTTQPQDNYCPNCGARMDGDEE